MKLVIVGITVCLVVMLHQAAYHFVFNLVQTKGTSITVAPFFSLVEVWNSGVSFGMFNSIPSGKWLLSAVALAITAWLAVLAIRANTRREVVAIGLIIGGAVGNTLDRLRYGAVADYLDFHAFGYHWPAFNLTDSAIFIGVCMMLLNSFFVRKEQPGTNLIKPD